jgi:hypothetical protein
MEFNKIIHISGKSGLFEMVSNRPNGIIAKAIEDGVTQFYSNRIFQFTPLESIEMYTSEDNIPLKDVMQAAKNKVAQLPSITVEASADELKKYFKEILPTYDDERVKISDIKKFIKWFAICKDFDLSNIADNTDVTSKSENELQPTAASPIEDVAPKPKKAKAKKAITDTEEVKASSEAKKLKNTTTYNKNKK